MNCEAPATMRKDAPHTRLSAMVVIPCLNEAAHIERLLQDLDGAADRLDMRIVVADGGSTDGTREILGRIAAANPRVVVLDNPRKLQGAAVNLAVREFGDTVDCLIRIDAHADYPDDFCDRLIEEAQSTGADSVVVVMTTKGRSLFQQAAAMAQNSKLGNGGSKHRAGAKGHWTDHGHHALMRIAPFRTVGGYDESFGHNEDAELDHRLGAAGYRIWLTDRTGMTYYPRDTVYGLFRQYVNYGKGRASNFLKHRTLPKLRQMLPAMVLPCAAGALLALFHWWTAVPFFLWVLICLGYGVVLGVGQRDPRAVLASVAAMVMHFGWSAGFWLQMLRSRRRGKGTS
ncbi:glycosyltransferase family 2 protein [Nitratireductor sp. GCM10026969]|uniref:glycosyltransferase family 2 protein n=1 Tax=Nitratireductor sp. GCM10026969 TaxID=3252645 RepID=UPI003622C8F7